MGNSGWIKLHRKVVESDWYTDINTNHLFTHLILMANHKDKSWRGIPVRRGQLITSREKLSMQTGLTIRQVRYSLDKLKSTKNVTIKTTNKFSLVTVVNYSEYQSEEEKVASNVSRQWPTNGQQMATNKNERIKEVKKESVCVKSVSLEDGWTAWACNEFATHKDEVKRVFEKFLLEESNQAIEGKDRAFWFNRFKKYCLMESERFDGFKPAPVSAEKAHFHAMNTLAFKKYVMKRFIVASDEKRLEKFESEFGPYDVAAKRFLKSS